MKPNWCIHYTGLINRKCGNHHNFRAKARPLAQAEIELHKENYPNLPTADTAISKRIPCHENNRVRTCSDFCLPTEQEIVEDKAKTDAFITQFLERLAIVRPAIEKDIASKNMQKKTCRGIINCLICDSGKIHYGYAGSVNGHIHAQCTTKNCIQWIE